MPRLFATQYRYVLLNSCEVIEVMYVCACARVSAWRACVGTSVVRACTCMGMRVRICVRAYVCARPRMRACVLHFFPNEE